MLHKITINVHLRVTTFYTNKIKKKKREKNNFYDKFPAGSVKCQRTATRNGRTPRRKDPRKTPRTFTGPMAKTHGAP